MKPMANKSADSGDFQLFNLATMSGVFPGTRTARYQRIRLQPQEAGGEIVLARLLWYDAPLACMVMLAQPDKQETPLLRLDAPEPSTLATRLHDGLVAAGYTMLTCSQCRHWLPTAQLSEDQLPVGRCSYRSDDYAIPPALNSLDRQSGLALDCPHFDSRAQGDSLTASAAATDQSEADVAARAEDARIELRRAAVLRKEEEAEASSLRGRLRRLLGKAEPPAPSKSWTDELLERSGVGAGTESCFACQGRIANLGALTVASPEDDKQTYSVWRCRRCYTTYLNCWIDRWERLDSLETDETYWRISPAEAVALLAIIASVTGGEHPQGRHARQAEQAHFAAFVAERPPLSRQIKLGR